MNPMQQMPPEIRDAHRHCINHRSEIEASGQCGCFYCLRIFPPGDIRTWITEPGGGNTALCPHCDIDSVIGSASGYPITSDFLREMRHHWFDIPYTL